MFAHIRSAWRALPAGLRKAIAALLGGSVVGVGLVMLITPGPAIVVIPIGLSILAAEFAWVRHWIRKWVPEAWQPGFVREPPEAGPEGGSPAAASPQEASGS